MGTRLLVDDRYGTAESLIRRLLQKRFALQGAFWLTTSEFGTTHLYLVTKSVDEVGLATTGREVNSYIRQMPETMITPSDIKLISPTSYLAKSIESIAANSSGRQPIRILDQSIGGLDVQEAYIYPAQMFSKLANSPMTKEEVIRELVVPLMTREKEEMKPVKINLKNGDVFIGTATSISWGPDQPIVAQFVVENEPAPRNVSVDDIMAIE